MPETLVGVEGNDASSSFNKLVIVKSASSNLCNQSNASDLKARSNREESAPTAMAASASLSALFQSPIFLASMHLP
uniref:Uncharacterized protein n=1 Tax=Zea mays TaxID=4577 RepID=C4J043_MAIZE|nr:unknown [Zea mays]ACR37311.1 unknown [Zea mays]